MKDLPASETLAISGTAAFPVQSFSALTEEPVFCPVLKTIAFFDCGVGLDLMKKLGEALERRRDSTAAGAYRIIVSSIGTMPDRTSVRRLRETVPCVGIIVVDDGLLDLW